LLEHRHEAAALLARVGSGLEQRVERAALDELHGRTANGLTPTERDGPDEYEAPVLALPPGRRQAGGRYPGGPGPDRGRVPEEAVARRRDPHCGQAAGRFDPEEGGRVVRTQRRRAVTDDCPPPSMICGGPLPPATKSHVRAWLTADLAGG